jgi:acetyl-CoA carboxylase biotin carboxyl carrier protein
MDFKNLKEFIEIAKEAGASELEYESGDKKFSVSFPTASSVAPVAHVSHAPVVQSAQPPAVPTAGHAKQDGLLDVTSPFVGTFYRSSSPDSDPYAKVGDRVSPGQVLCIVEAMKIMNEIESEVSGEIVEICVENETYVEFGQTLFRIKP